MRHFWVLRLFPRAWRDRYEDEFRALLEDYPSTTGHLVDLLMAASDAQLRYRQLPDGMPAIAGGSGVSSLSYRQAQTRVRWLASLYADVLLFVLVNLLLLGINLLTTPETLWFIYPLWGWGMFLAVHAAIALRGRARFAAHVALFAALNGGLAWINVEHSDQLWFQWPLGATATVLIAHALIAFRVTDYFGAHVVTYVLGLAQMAATALKYPEAEYEFVVVGITWTIVLLVHAVARFSNFSALKVHLLLFAGVNAQLIVQNSMRSDEIWFHYPLFVWAVILGTHVAVEMGWVPLFDPGWDERKRRELAALAGLNPDQAGCADEPEALDTIALRAQSLWRLHFHAFAFVVGFCSALVLNILTYTAGAWTLWPLWGWGIVLAAHAGYVLARRRFFGAHLALFVAINAGLIAIDAIYSGWSWFYWPLAGTALLLGIHFLINPDTLRAIREWEARRVASMVE